PSRLAAGAARGRREAEAAKPAWLEAELRDQGQVVRHAPPDAALRDLHAQRLHAPRINVIELRERQPRGIGPQPLPLEIAQARLVHQRAELAAPIVEVAGDDDRLA